MRAQEVKHINNGYTKQDECDNEESHKPTEEKREKTTDNGSLAG